MAISLNTLENKGTIQSNYLEDTIYNLLDQTFEIPSSGFSYNIFLVSKEYIARPDLVSLDAYGTTGYADIICKINGISNPFELNEGMEIIIPVTENIDFFSVEPGKMDAEEIEIQPIAKTKHEKRKVNEAIVGNSRFRIDPNMGVVIY